MLQEQLLQAMMIGGRDQQIEIGTTRHHGVDVSGALPVAIGNLLAIQRRDDLFQIASGRGFMH